MRIWCKSTLMLIHDGVYDANTILPNSIILLFPCMLSLKLKMVSDAHKSRFDVALLYANSVVMTCGLVWPIVSIEGNAGLSCIGILHTYVYMHVLYNMSYYSSKQFPSGAWHLVNVYMILWSGINIDLTLSNPFPGEYPYLQICQFCSLNF